MEVTTLLLIFFARIMDVSLGTIRLLFISRGLKYLAPVLGFIEVSIWLVAIRNILLEVQGPWGVVAYAGGFAVGTLAGMLIDERLSMGKVLFRVITRVKKVELLAVLKESGKKVTWMNGEGKNGPVLLIFAIVNRKDIKTLIKGIKSTNPNAFYSIEDVRYAYELGTPGHRFGFGSFRKAK